MNKFNFSCLKINRKNQPINIGLIFAALVFLFIFSATAVFLSGRGLLDKNIGLLQTAKAQDEEIPMPDLEDIINQLDIDMSPFFPVEVDGEVEDGLDENGDENDNNNGTEEKADGNSKINIVIPKIDLSDDYKDIKDQGGKEEKDKQGIEEISKNEVETIINHRQFVPLGGTEKGQYERIMQAYGQDLPINSKYALAYFIQHGTPGTKILGSGERAGVVNSYRAAFNKMPQTEEEWQDVIKIANGRWPKERNLNKENEVENNVFKKIYLRNPNMENPNDNAAVTVITYGLRPADRNMASEKAAIGIFKNIYGYNPRTADDWDIVRAIAYSGAVR